MTVSEETTFCDNVAVTVTALSGDVAKARQISAVPLWVFVLRTSTQVRPAPEMLETTALFAAFLRSVATKARNSSLPAVVENGEVAIVVPAAARSADTLASMVIPVFAANVTPVMFAPLTVTD
jgi:regulator of RNase E activity RraA